MNDTRPGTLGELRESEFHGRSVRDEVRANLIRKLRNGEELFPGIVGYEESVTPAIVNSLLARQNFILLGLRGQAKSRIIRQLVDLLDPEIPILRGSEVNDDPFRPISKYGRLMVEDQGDEAPIDWVPRDARFVEKLATPDVTIADMIGDVDPIKAARGGHVLSDELTIHYGLLPRANRGIFAINELPDLSGKIQVGLFNILQEGDIQIKGYPVRMALDLLMVFTANPEDYTARGKIITPLKDRIGAEVRTHYPQSLELGAAITRQEAWVQRDGRTVVVPRVVAEVVERTAFLAREDKRVDQRSGVSQRMPISVLENAVSNAERRALLVDEEQVVPRLSDIYAALPAITGKLELEYEGELVGGDRISRELIGQAASDQFMELGGDLEADEVEEVVNYFDRGGVLQLSDTASAAASLEGFGTVPGLLEVVEELGLRDDDASGATVAACELVLETLVAERRLSRSDEGAYGRARQRRRRGGPGGGPGATGGGAGGGGGSAGGGGAGGTGGGGAGGLGQGPAFEV